MERFLIALRNSAYPSKARAHCQREKSHLTIANTARSKVMRQKLPRKFGYGDIELSKRVGKDFAGA
jgi:hypothetical protein